MRLSLLCLCDADVLLMYAGYIFVTRKRDGLLLTTSLFPFTMLAGYIFVTRDDGCYHFVVTCPECHTRMLPLLGKRRYYVCGLQKCNPQWMRICCFINVG